MTEDMTKPYTGGPDFPQANDGRTLRDYFAAQVLPHIIGNLEDWPDNKSEIEAQTELSYMYADAMLEARDQ
ncbi:GP38 [Ruegeria sp. TrichCH4B]|nr:GP38 [Ruegeria sp. TrichCH4B]